MLRNILVVSTVVVMGFVCIQTPASSFTLSVSTTSRTLETVEDTNGIVSTGTSSTGSYSQSLSPLGPQLIAEFVSSGVPAPGSYTSYVVAAEMFAAYDESEGALSWGLAITEMALTISVDSAVNYSINGLLLTNGTVGGGDFSLTGPGGEICSLSACFGSSGVLPAGEYDLSALAGAGVGGPSSDVFGDATLTFDVTLSEIPDPATAWLLGFGLTALALRRRQRLQH